MYRYNTFSRLTSTSVLSNSRRTPKTWVMVDKYSFSHHYDLTCVQNRCFWVWGTLTINRDMEKLVITTILTTFKLYNVCSNLACLLFTRRAKSSPFHLGLSKNLLAKLIKLKWHAFLLKINIQLDISTWESDSLDNDNTSRIIIPTIEKLSGIFRFPRDVLRHRKVNGRNTLGDFENSWGPRPTRAYEIPFGRCQFFRSWLNFFV